MYAFDVFFSNEGKLLQLHQLNQSEKKIKEIKIQEFNVLDTGIKFLKQIHELCKRFNHDMPTEMKLHYNVKENNLKAKYKYKLVYSNDETLLPDDIFDQWFNEVKKEYNS